MTRERLTPGPQALAIEDAYARGAAPTRIFALLLPAWRAEIRATVTTAQDYELIDRYLERGIATAGLDTAASLAGFFGLDEVVVDRALRALTAIGHLTSSGGRVALTGTGQRSVAEGVRYAVARQDRRVLYFDAFGSRPLPARYFGGRAPAAGDGFTPLVSPRGLRAEAVAELAGRPDRERLGLPEGAAEVELAGAPAGVSLPAYVIRAAGPRLLAYTRAPGTADPELTSLCEQTPEVTAVIEAEEAAAAGGTAQRARRWLARQGLDGCQPRQRPGGTWRVTVPAVSFGAGAALGISQAGSFLALGGDILHLWCDDREVRRRALLERVDGWLGPRGRPEPAQVQARVSRLARQLELGEASLAGLAQLAARAGKAGLAARLGKLS